MACFSNEVTISSPVARVWEVFTDFERWPDWTPTALRLESLGPEPPGVGSRVRIEQPKLAPAVWTITEWSPGRSFTWVSRTSGVSASAAHVLEPVAEGCRVTQTFCFPGLLGALAGLLMGSLVRRYMALEAAGLKQVCEADAPPGRTMIS